MFLKLNLESDGELTFCKRGFLCSGLIVYPLPGQEKLNGFLKLILQVCRDHQGMAIGGFIQLVNEILTLPHSGPFAFMILITQTAAKPGIDRSANSEIRFQPGQNSAYRESGTFRRRSCILTIELNSPDIFHRIDQRIY